MTSATARAVQDIIGNDNPREIQRALNLTRHLAGNQKNLFRALNDAKKLLVQAIDNINQRQPKVSPSVDSSSGAPRKSSESPSSAESITALKHGRQCMTRSDDVEPASKFERTLSALESLLSSAADVLDIADRFVAIFSHARFTAVEELGKAIEDPDRDDTQELLAIADQVLAQDELKT